MSSDREQSIRQRAYGLWEKEGGGHGRHEDHWHQASREHDETAAGEGAADGTAGGAGAIAAPDGTTFEGAGTPADQTPLDGPVAPPVKKAPLRRAKAPADQTPLDGPVAPPVADKPVKARKPKSAGK